MTTLDERIRARLYPLYVDSTTPPDLSQSTMNTLGWQVASLVAREEHQSAADPRHLRGEISDLFQKASSPPDVNRVAAALLIRLESSELNPSGNIKLLLDTLYTLANDFGDPQIRIPSLIALTKLAAHNPESPANQFLISEISVSSDPLELLHIAKSLNKSPLSRAPAAAKQITDLLDRITEKVEGSQGELDPHTEAILADTLEYVLRCREKLSGD